MSVNISAPSPWIFLSVANVVIFYCYWLIINHSFYFQKRHTQETIASIELKPLLSAPTFTNTIKRYELRDPSAILDKDRFDMIEKNYDKLCNEIRINGTDVVDIMVSSTSKDRCDTTSSDLFIDKVKVSAVCKFKLVLIFFLVHK